MKIFTKISNWDWIKRRLMCFFFGHSDQPIRQRSLEYGYPMTIKKCLCCERTRVIRL